MFAETSVEAVPVRCATRPVRPEGGEAPTARLLFDLPAEQAQRR